MKFYTVYILECSDNTFYVGITSNLDLRLEQHKNGNNTSSYTNKRRPLILKWFQNFTNPAEAIKFEKQLKGWSRAKKIALIEEDWGRLILYSKNHTDFGKPDTNSI
ncbi:GIY-YIG nuclease family protein [Gillisia marina]|uniref:GIY-YIG nuclease family protein n=1 Tax=Gillisia marina TaxID=1167637 RepID=UPI000493D83B|nr:GIY-YIG nuclease family protein [Gillisia marina]